MKTKGMWFRILGLLLVLSFVSACGAGDGGAGASAAPDSTGGASPAASAAQELAEPSAEASMAEASAAASTEASAAASTEASSAAASEAASSAASAEGSAAGSAAAGGTIKLGSKNFTEALLLGEMYALLLENNGFTVERNFGLASETVAHEALKAGEIDMYPEYTSTALLTILKLPSQSDREAIYNTVKSEYEKQFQITWLDAAPFENNQALAMTKARSDELGIKTYSDLATKAGELVLGGPPEYFEREDGLKGLQGAYGGFEFRDTKQLDPALRYGALQDGQIDVVVAFGTDGQIGGFDLQLLEDDKSYYPPYQVAPVIRQDVLEANPQIAEVLNPLAPILDNTTMSNLNWSVDNPDGGREVEEIAEEFLTQQGLLK